MSGGGKRLTTSQRSFAIWHRSDLHSKAETKLAVDARKLANKTKPGVQQVRIQRAAELFEQGAAKMKAARDMLMTVEDAE